MPSTPQERQAKRREKLKSEGRRQILVTLSAEALQRLDELAKKAKSDRNAILEALIQRGEVKRGGKVKVAEQLDPVVPAKETAKDEAGVFRVKNLPAQKR